MQHCLMLDRTAVSQLSCPDFVNFSNIYCSDNPTFIPPPAKQKDKKFFFYQKVKKVKNIEKRQKPWSKEKKPW
jgi:hypothetical protein